jgi:hypothetical protein
MTIRKRALSLAAPLATLVLLATSLNSGYAIAQIGKSDITPVLVRNIDEPGRNPFQTSQNVLFTNFSATAFLVVPTGKIAVIETVSASGAVSSGGTFQGFVRCFDGNMEVNHSLVFTAQGEVNGFTQYSSNQPIRCYAIPGGLSVHVQTSNFNSSQHTFVMAASGYVLTQ